MKTEVEVIELIKKQLKNCSIKNKNFPMLMASTIIQMTCDQLCWNGDLGIAQWFCNDKYPEEWITFQLGPEGFNDGVYNPRFKGEWIIDKKGRTAFRTKTFN